MISQEEKKKRTAERNKASYEWYKSHGICVKCKTEKATPGHVMCNICREDWNRFSRYRYEERTEIILQRQRTRRQGRIDRHECVECGTPLEDGNEFRRCPRCQERRREYARKHYRKKKLDNISKVFIY